MFANPPSPVYIIGSTPISTVPITVIKRPEEIDSDFYLKEDSLGWILCDRKARFSPQSINFSDAYYRFRGGIEYLPKAFKGLTEKTILDATAGWGRDAWLLAYRGFSVTLYERNPYLAFLLEQGLRSAQQSLQLSHIAKRMTVYYKDAHMMPSSQYAAIYLDPMYPPRRKQAKVKKQMQILHALLNSTDNTHNKNMLQQAISCSKQRVVVKRPKDAPYLENLTPHHQIIAPNTRYDVYQATTML